MVVSAKTPCNGTATVAAPAASTSTGVAGPSSPAPAWFHTTSRNVVDGGSPPMVYETWVCETPFSCAPAVSRPRTVQSPAGPEYAASKRDVFGTDSRPTTRQPGLTAAAVRCTRL